MTPRITSGRVAATVTATAATAVPVLPAADENRDTLEARAALQLAPWKKERTFFLNYDAWCDPSFAGHLRAPQSLLSPTALGFFRVAAPPPLAHLALLPCAFRLFPSVPRDRARMAAAGDDYGVKLRVEGDDKLLLDHHGLDAGKLVDGLAQLQYALFKTHYPQKDKNRPSRELQLAFARFADGQLRIAQGTTTQLNAEPDSAFFFLFAEFCIQACAFATAPSASWWLRLAALFARLDEVYCRRYPPPGGTLRWTAYLAQHHDTRTPYMAKKELVALIDEVEARAWKVEEVVAAVTASARKAFLQDVG